MKAAEMFGQPACHQARACMVCNQATKIGKPFCTDHVLQHPYAAVVQSGWRNLVARLCVALRAGEDFAGLSQDLREVYYSAQSVGSPHADPITTAATLEAMWLS